MIAQWFDGPALKQELLPDQPQQLALARGSVCRDSPAKSKPKMGGSNEVVSCTRALLSVIEFSCVSVARL